MTITHHEDKSHEQCTTTSRCLGTARAAQRGLFFVQKPAQ